MDSINGRKALDRWAGERAASVLFEDTAAMLGLLIALLGIALSQILGMPILDGVASLLIGLLLAGTAAGARLWGLASTTLIPPPARSLHAGPIKVHSCPYALIMLPPDLSKVQEIFSDVAGYRRRN